MNDERQEGADAGGAQASCRGSLDPVTGPQAARWLFAYGSLIWRPDFDYEASGKAALRGWRRRFWQASPDHRGVPAAPGRVVTLVADPGAICWGVAFLPRAARWETTLSELDRREQNGYARVSVDIEFEDGSVRPGLTYIAAPDNPSFAGPAPLDGMVHQIIAASGPSGPNLEYVLRLAETLERLGIHDEEVDVLRVALTRAADARATS